MIEFHLDSRSGVPAYLQLVQQVRQAIRLGMLRPGDQLPTVKEVVASLTINPNTVLHAYRQLDWRDWSRAGAAWGRSWRRVRGLPPPDGLKRVRSSLDRWVASARSGGTRRRGHGGAVRRGAASRVAVEGVA